MKIFFVFSCFFKTKYYNFVKKTFKKFFFLQNFANINKISLKKIMAKIDDKSLHDLL